MSDDRNSDAWLVVAALVIVILFTLCVIVVHQRDNAQRQLDRPQTVQVPRTATAKALKVCQHVEIDFGPHKAAEVIGRDCGR